MHVLVTADTLGGVWTYTRELVTGLVQRGHKITLVSFGKLPCTPQIAWMQGLAGLDFRPTPFALEWMQDCAEDIRLSSQYLEKLIGEVKPDLLHFNQYAYGAMRISLPKVVVAHSDVVSWWMAVKGEEPPQSDWMKWYRETVEAGIGGADEVVAPSGCVLEDMETYNAHPAHARVVYNGRDPSLFNARSKKDNQVVSVGRVWDEAKQVSLLSNHTQAVPVFVLGSQEHPDKSLSSLDAANTPDGITFCGQQSEQQIREWFAKSSIYAGCSRYEPFGLALVEAAMSGCALIANDIPSFRELWGDSAYFFRKNDAESLAEGIRILCSDPPLRLEYARRAHNHAMRNFGADRMVDSYEQLYGSLTAQEATA